MKYSRMQRSTFSVLASMRPAFIPICQPLVCAAKKASNHSRVFPISVFSSSFFSSSSSRTKVDPTPPKHDSQQQHKPSVSHQSVNSFSSLTPWIKRIILRIHPDMIATQPQDYIDTNEKSLAVFFRLMDILAARCEDPSSSSSSTKLDTLQPRYDFLFYFEHQAGAKEVGIEGSDASPTNTITTTTTHEASFSSSSPFPLHQCAVDIVVPPAMEDRLRIMASRRAASGGIEQAKAEWLYFTVMVVKRLCAAVEIKNVRFTLAPEIAELAAKRELQDDDDDGGSGSSSSSQQKNGKKRGKTMFESVAPPAESTTAALLANIAKHSPIAQGKTTHAFAEKGLLGDNVYSLRVRRDRADAIVGRVGYVTFIPATTSSSWSLSPNAAAASMSRLRKVFIDHHDALHAYHPLWNRVRITVTSTEEVGSGDDDGRGGRGSNSSSYYADAATLSFAIPSTFTEQEFVRLVEQHFPRMIERARASLRKEDLGVEKKRKKS